MAIATCNIKVNGRWVRAGEHYGEEERKPEKVEQVKPVEEVPAEVPAEEVKPAETPKAEVKSKTASRRKSR